MPGITPAKISAIIAHIMSLLAFSVAISPAFTALYILYTLRNTNIATMNMIKNGIAKIMVKRNTTAAPIQPMRAIMLNMNAISMYVFIVLSLSVDIAWGGGGGGGFEYVILFNLSFVFRLS